MKSKIDDSFDAIHKCLRALEPLEEAERTFALDMILSKLGHKGKTKDADAGKGGAGGGLGGGPQVDVKTIGPREFVKAKKPQTDVERITVLAYYLTHNRGTAHFKTRELTGLNTEAGGDQFSNAAFTAANAVKQNRYLAAAGGGKRQISTLGEDVVSALPDRDALAKVLAERPKRKNRGGRPKGKK